MSRVVLVLEGRGSLSFGLMKYRCQTKIIMENVLIVGHSFIRRLENEGPPIVLDSPDAVVNLCGYIGLKPLNLVEDILGKEVWCVNTFGLPTVVVLYLGTNDMCQYCTKTPEEVAEEVIKVVNNFRNLHVRRILLPECLPRYGGTALGATPFMWRSDITSVEGAEVLFEECVRRFNKHLKYKTQFMHNVSYLRLRGLHDNMKERFVDGVHLNADDCGKFAKDLKRAVVTELWKCFQ